MVSFSVDLEGFSLRLRVEAAPRVPSANKLRTEVGSGVCTKEHLVSEQYRQHKLDCKSQNLMVAYQSIDPVHNRKS